MSENKKLLLTLKIERGFWIGTQLAILVFTFSLIGNAYGWLLSLGITGILFVCQSFIVKRIYNLKRCINMIPMLELIADKLKKDDKK